MAVELVDRLAILVAARRFLGMGAAKSRALRFDNNVRMQHLVGRFTCISFRCFLRDMRREIVQRLFAALHGTLGSYLRDAFHEGSADVVACPPVPSSGFGFFLFSSFCLVASTAFSCKKKFQLHPHQTAVRVTSDIWRLSSLLIRAALAK